MAVGGFGAGRARLGPGRITGMGSAPSKDQHYALPSYRSMSQCTFQSCCQQEDYDAHELQAPTRKKNIQNSQKLQKSLQFSDSGVDQESSKRGILRNNARGWEKWQDDALESAVEIVSGHLNVKPPGVVTMQAMRCSYKANGFTARCDAFDARFWHKVASHVQPKSAGECLLRYASIRSSDVARFSAPPKPAGKDTRPVV